MHAYDILQIISVIDFSVGLLDVLSLWTFKLFLFIFHLH